MIFQILRNLGALLTYSETDYVYVNTFLGRSATVLQIAAVAGILLLIIRNPRLKEHKRTEDRIMFSECILVLLQNLLNLGVTIFYTFDVSWTNLVVYIEPSINEFLYMLTILQWLVFVDFCIYRSPDHIRRRYKHAVLPILFLLVIDIVQSIYAFVVYDGTNSDVFVVMNVIQVLKLMVELFYIILAVLIVREHSKKSREPKFLRLEAFIVPFILGCLFRFYDSAFMALGIILTYGAVKRRDIYLDHETGFFNSAYLDYLSDFRDKKGYTGDTGILISSKGHEKELASLIEEIRPADSDVFVLDSGTFLFLGQEIRGKAGDILIRTVTGLAGENETPFTPVAAEVIREDNESMSAYVERIRSQDPAGKGI